MLADAEDYCSFCGLPIAPDESYYEPVNPDAPLKKWHEDCAPEEDIEDDMVYLVHR